MQALNFINERLKNAVTGLLVGIIAGAVLGTLIGYSLGLSVPWEDAAPVHLREDLRSDYFRIAIDSFARTGNIQEAQRRWLEMGAEAESALAAVEADPQYLTEAEIQGFKLAVGAEGTGLPPVTEGQPGAAPEEEGGGNTLLIVIGCVVTLVIGIFILFSFLARRGPVGEGESAAMQAAEVTAQAEQTDFESIGEAPPLSQFMTTYMLGDDLFDDSFSIDSPAGEFLGECGVGIAETTGPGEPKRVNAFEVWLFDKNDIQTVTKVLMSGHAFHDVETHDRLSAKGDPVLAKPESQVVLETAKLRLMARVVDMSYGDDPSAGSDNHFERLTLELAVWPI